MFSSQLSSGVAVLGQSDAAMTVSGDFIAKKKRTLHGVLLAYRVINIHYTSTYYFFHLNTDTIIMVGFNGDYRTSFAVITTWKKCKNVFFFSNIFLQQ